MLWLRVGYGTACVCDVCTYHCDDDSLHAPDDSYFLMMNSINLEVWRKEASGSKKISFGEGLIERNVNWWTKGVFNINNEGMVVNL